MHPLDVGGVGCRHDEVVLVAHERHHLEPAEHGLGDRTHERGVEGFCLHVDEGETELARERPRDVHFGDEAQLDEAFADAAPRLTLAREAGLDLRVGDDAGFDEDGRDVTARGYDRCGQESPP